MRKVAVAVRTKEEIEKIWKIITDVEKLFKLSKFVREVSIKEPIKEGVVFYDVTGIILVSLPVKHKIIEIKKHDKFAMEADLPLKSGKMYQTIYVKDMGKFREIKAEIRFNIDFPVFDIIFGRILEIRLKQMVNETFKNIEKYLNLEERIEKIRFNKIIEK